MKIWLISGAWHIVLGIGIGWVLLPHPQWIDDLHAKVIAKIKFW